LEILAIITTKIFDRYAIRVLADMRQYTASELEKGAHVRYRELFLDMMDANDFYKHVDNFGNSRNMAPFLMSQIQFQNLITPEEIANFSPELQDFLMQSFNI